ncbi:SulP family inorganic anion transporter [bacterium]|nr:SulP family inorganic anion transporter [bacterium]
MRGATKDPERPPNRARQPVDTPLASARRWTLLAGMRPASAADAGGDVLAGLSLAAMNVPQALGYSTIAGMPVVTGLYTLLLPLLAFAALGSSRFLVVAADSATAAILASGLAPLAAPGSNRYVALAGLVALLTAAYLLLARLFRFGFLADFLSQTVLVGFLAGVGVQVGIAVLGEMLGLDNPPGGALQQVAALRHGLAEINGAALALSTGVVAVVLVCRAVSPRLPGALIAVGGAIAASAAFDLAGRGLHVIGPIAGGLPHLTLPPLDWRDIRALVPVAASCFLVIVAQSAATARIYAVRHRQSVDENDDLVGLAAANLAAAATGTFVVNGSPTQTAMVEAAGGRSQLAHVSTAAVVALVLLFLAEILSYLPRCVLGAIVFTIAVGLIDLRSLAAIRRESVGEFRLAVTTALVVVGAGVEMGILLAMALSLMRHVRHSYLPHTAVLVADESGQWRATPARPGAASLPGVIIFRFGADLFYANADHFATTLRRLIASAPAPVRWLVIDAGAITAIDYSAARVFGTVLSDLRQAGVTVLLVHVPPSLAHDLARHRLTDAIGVDHMIETLREALAYIGAAPASAGTAPSACR